MSGRMAHMKIVEEIPLPNHLTVEVWDLSRPIAADTTKVEILIKIKVDLKPSYFIKPEHFELVQKILGPQIFFEYRKERTFVNNCNRDAIFQELLDSLKRDSLPYLSKQEFPGSFAMSRYWDIEKNRYKYRSFLQTPPS
jgi:hypothetical protein